MNRYLSYCGFVSIIGRSNVGKSTLMNKLLGEKISITSHKSQTTREYITGIYTEDNYQIIYLDTPGVNFEKNQSSINNKKNNFMNSSIDNVSLIILVIDGINWTTDDEIIIDKLYMKKSPVILAINKLDKIKNKDVLLPFIKFLSDKKIFLEIIPISAKTGKNVNYIVDIAKKKLPYNNHYYSKECVTTCSERFIASEIIREKLMRFLGNELPYESVVEIANFVSDKKNSYKINGIILVKHNSQKKIIIGQKGNKIKTISKNARMDMEKMFKIKVHLYLWVKIYPYFYKE
ncbi:GTPase Era [Candidatus Pantoea edessiphila]|uniref:GTPase Era n=1 Tax=Candidatus Pantoea edessiphila TaxID=2044610 RepID=A0A2P5SWE9_9GAMM|nr:GTPase Era [Candidatus Pantoea edessiphila]PPI86668.1 GTPase Era [Candidatus Pantoea edessiphila]